MSLKHKLLDWWRGNAQPRAAAWEAFAHEIIRRVGHCEACGATTQLEAHHKKPYHLYPELELLRPNVMVLHRPCHLLIGHLGDWKAYNPSVDVDAARLYAEVQKRPYTKELGK